MDLIQFSAPVPGGQGADDGAQPAASPLKRLARFREALLADLLAAVREAGSLEALTILQFDLEELQDGLEAELAHFEHGLELVTDEADLWIEAAREEVGA